MSKTCFSCQTYFSFLKSGKLCPMEKGGCGQLFCSKCLNYSLATADTSPEKPKISTFCKSCFQKHSNLKFAENEKVTIISAPNPTISLVFVHGGSGNRYMFLPHAKELVKKGPYKCILLDLPGHGCEMDREL